jgi:hypothetical protein
MKRAHRPLVTMVSAISCCLAVSCMETDKPSGDASVAGTGGAGSGVGGASSSTDAAAGMGAGGAGNSGGAGGAAGGNSGGGGVGAGGTVVVPVNCQPTGTMASLEIGPNGGTLTSTDGKAALTVPDGALAQMTALTISAVTCGASDGDPSATYDFGPNGTTFAKAVLVTLPYAGAPSGDTETFAPVGAYLKDAAWHVIPALIIDETSKTASIATDHFTVHTIVRGPAGIAIAPAPSCATACARNGCQINGGRAGSKGGATCVVTKPADVIAVHANWIGCHQRNDLASNECGCWAPDARDVCGGPANTQGGLCCPGEDQLCTFAAPGYFFGCCKTSRNFAYTTCSPGFVRLSVNTGSYYACLRVPPGGMFTKPWPFEYECEDVKCLIASCD